MADGSSARKRQKRAVLTNVSAAQSGSHGQHVMSADQRTPVGEDYNYLLRWQGFESGGDEIIDWDNEGWDKDENHNDAVNEDEGERDSVFEAQPTRDDETATSTGFEHDGLEAEASAIRQSRQKDERRRKVLEETVIGIINDSMKLFADEWYPGKDTELVGVEKDQAFDPVFLWEEAEKYGRRDFLIERYRSDIKYFKYRLDVLAAEICKLRSSAKHVRQQCKNLEVHVQNLEEAKWYLSIYELPPENEPGKESEVIDLDSTPDSSEHGDTSEMLVDVERPLIRPDNTKESLMKKRSGEVEEVLVDEEVFALPERHRRSDLTFKKGGAHRTINPTTTTTTTKDTEQRDFPRRSLQEARGISFTHLDSLSCESDVIPFTEKDEALVAHKAPASYRASSQMKRMPYGDRPEVASIFTISQWSMADLVASKDRKRITMKILLHMTSEERQMIRTRIEAVRKSNLIREINDYIKMLIRKGNRLLGVLPSDLPKVRTITHFFLCWWYAEDYMERTPSHEKLLELDTDLLESNDLQTFYDWIYYALRKTFSEEAFRNAHAPSQEEVIVISDDEAEAKTPSRAPLSQRRSAKRPSEVVSLD